MNGKQALLSVGAVLCAATAVGTAIYVTPKAKKILEEHKTKKETVKEIAKLYAPTAIAFTTAAGCVLAKDYIGKKAAAAITASTAATTSYLVANRDKLKKFVENPRVKKLTNSLIIPTKDEFNHQTIEETGNGDLLCIEGYSGRIFRSSEEAVLDAQKKLNELYLDEEHNGEFGYCCMNDYYKFLNIEESQFGFEYGWANNEDWFYRNESIEFKNNLIESDAPGNEFGEPIFVTEIDDSWFPMQCWQEI